MHGSKNFLMVKKPQKIRADLMKGLLDLIVLHFVDEEPMYGYQMIKKIQDKFGVQLGASTIYPLLNDMEEKGYLESRWDTESDRPRKIYHLTTEGETLLNYTEDSLNTIVTEISHPETEEE